jgi:hypothetical protein
MPRRAPGLLHLEEDEVTGARQRGRVDRIVDQRDRLFRDITARRQARQAPAHSVIVRQTGLVRLGQ